MNITAYFDESGSHTGAQVTAMAGYVADAIPSTCKTR